MVHDLNVKCKTLQPLEYLGECLCNSSRNKSDKMLKTLNLKDMINPVKLKLKNIKINNYVHQNVSVTQKSNTRLIARINI